MTRTEGLIQQHLAHLRRVDSRPDTIRHRGTNLRRTAALLPCELIDADAVTLWNYQDGLRDQQLSPATIRCYSSHLRMFFQWAVRFGHLASDPTLDLRPPRVQAGRANPIPEDRLSVAIACARDTPEWPIRTWLILAAYCGLRAGEISRVSRDSIGDETLDVDGKGGKPRTVPLPAPVRALLLAYADGPGQAPLWRHRTGRALTPHDVSQDCSRHLRGTGAECSLHKLRHRYATRLYRLSRDPMLVKQLLGHESLSTTQVYLGVSAELGRDVADQLARELKRGNPRQPRRAVDVASELRDLPEAS